MRHGIWLNWKSLCIAEARSGCESGTINIWGCGRMVRDRPQSGQVFVPSDFSRADRRVLARVVGVQTHFGTRVPSWTDSYTTPRSSRSQAKATGCGTPPGANPLSNGLAKSPKKRSNSNRNIHNPWPVLTCPPVAGFDPPDDTEWPEVGRRSERCLFRPFQDIGCASGRSS